MRKPRRIPHEGRFSRRSLILGLGLLVWGSWLGAGCSLSAEQNPVEIATPAATSSIQPSPDVQANPLPTFTPPGADPFPEPEGQIESSFSFEYQCNLYAVTLSLYQSSYQYYQSQDKNFYYRGELPADWQAQFYLNFLSSEDDLPAVKNLIAAVSQAVNQEEDELVIALVSLVQHLRYDCDKLFNFGQPGGADYQTNYPYETLYTRTGVCGDTSILLGKILQELGYGAAFLIYDQSNHMAVGIQCPRDAATYQWDGKGYCYIETTGPSRIGVKPTNIAGVEFDEDPLLIPIAAGKTFSRMTSLAEEMKGETIRYGQRILQLANCQEIQLYQEIVVRRVTISEYENQLDRLQTKSGSAKAAYEEELEIYISLGCDDGPWPPAKYQDCLTQYEILEEKVALYQDAVDEYNRMVDLYGAEVDLLNLAVRNFNALMAAKDQSCSAVFSEGIAEPEASE